MDQHILQLLDPSLFNWQTDCRRLTERHISIKGSFHIFSNKCLPPSENTQNAHFSQKPTQAKGRARKFTQHPRTESQNISALCIGITSPRSHLNILPSPRIENSPSQNTNSLFYPPIHPSSSFSSFSSSFS